MLAMTLWTPCVTASTEATRSASTIVEMAIPAQRAAIPRCRRMTRVRGADLKAGQVWFIIFAGIAVMASPGILGLHSRETDQGHLAPSTTRAAVAPSHVRDKTATAFSTEPSVDYEICRRPILAPDGSELAANEQLEAILEEISLMEKDLRTYEEVAETIGLTPSTGFGADEFTEELRRIVRQRFSDEEADTPGTRQK